MAKNSNTRVALPTKRYRCAWFGIIAHSGQSVYFLVLILGLVLGLAVSANLGGMGSLIGTPPNAIAFSTGELETRDLRPGGILIGLLGPLAAGREVTSK